MAPVGQAGQVVSGELGDLVQGPDLVLQLQLAAAGPAARDLITHVNTISGIGGL